jgi:diaminopimelate decarboxylase
MGNRLSIEYISDVTKKAIVGYNISDCDTSLIIYDCDCIKSRISDLQRLFPKNTIHAIAAKSNPLIKILEIYKKIGAGIEAASLPELYIAEKIGFNNKYIVFDSPSKTISEIEYALKLGVHLNADSFLEIDRISYIKEKTNSKSNIGIRINPQIGSGTIKTTSVAEQISKFGIPINEHKEALLETYKKNKWLNGVHLHIGSQGISLEQLLMGLGKVYELVENINSIIKSDDRRIEYFDIGGGFPVSYGNNYCPKIDEYVSKIKIKYPNLLTNYKIITEFGRFINANAAWAISRVEYVKEHAVYKIISIHLGADFMIRKAYNPDDWYHEISVLDQDGKIKTGIDKKKYIVAGPLCFAGDIIAKDIELPEVNEGDIIVIHDVGAYTLSMWSRYNSRQIPKVIAYENNEFSTIKKRESLNDLFEFWK